MSMLTQCGTEKFDLSSVPRYLKYKIQFAKEHPDYFDPDGLLIFVGPQGSGKTISAVNYIYKVMELYPKCKLVTNIMLTDYPVVTYDSFWELRQEELEGLKGHYNEEELPDIMWIRYKQENRIFEFLDNDDFKKYDNDDYGLLFFVDEIQLYLNSLESKNVNMDTMTQISQQRKQRKHIVCTSQVYGRMAKPLREQFSEVVVCKNYMSILQVNKLVNRDSLSTESSSGTEISGVVKKKFMWLHDPNMYKRYDTYYVIERGKFVSAEKQVKEIYQNDRIGLPDNSKLDS